MKDNITTLIQLQNVCDNLPIAKIYEYLENGESVEQIVSINEILQ